MPGFSYTLRDYGNSDSAKITSEEKLWAAIMEGDKKDWAMTASADIAWNNLVNGHAFTVLGGHEITKDGKPYEKLVKIRNPWASEMYTGPWSDKSDLWTEDFKKQVNMTVANDGVFYMALKDMYKGFYEV
mgnify:CR=1 FL=1